MPGASVFALPLASVVWCYWLEIRPDSRTFLGAFEAKVDLTLHIYIMAGSWVCSRAVETGGKK